jgi:hypothetical protein
MKLAVSALAIATLSAVLAPGLVFAQSGTFSAAATDGSCLISAGGTFLGGTGVLGSLTTSLSTSSGGGLALDIRPSITTGLFTQTKNDTDVNSASSDIGIEVCVTVDGSGDGILPKSCVIYDQRFQQISSQLFSQLSGCFATTTATACTIASDCSFLGASYICNNPTGAAGAGVCVSGPNPLCNQNLIQSSLTAHSFEFVVPVNGKKAHVIEAEWKLVGAGTSSGNASTLSCVGPGMLTATLVSIGSLTTF